jgi:hypothetical protein
VVNKEKNEAKFRKLAKISVKNGFKKSLINGI